MLKYLKLRALYCLFIFLINVFSLFAQDSSQNTETRNLYRPPSERLQDTSSWNDDHFGADSVNHDSLEARLRFIEDSLLSRRQFILDSIRAREIFVRDSILRRERMRDSVLFLQAQLPRLLEGSLKTFTDDIIIVPGRIDITGDSMLTDYISIILPFTTDKPYTPWKSIINLSDNPVKFTVDTVSKKITTLRTPAFECSFRYGHDINILRIESKASIAGTRSGKLYKVPVDSVFFDNRGRVVKIKRYIHFHQVTGNYQKGAPLFLHLTQVKQFEYSGDVLTQYHVTKFCDREQASEPRKVCSILTCNITKQQNRYVLSKHSDPPNEYADGIFTYEFDPVDLLKSISFRNVKNTEDWTTFVEVNEDGNVSRYIYQNQGAVRKTLLVNYNPPGSKYPVETITCIFEDDGVSYYWINNTTGKSRQRDKLTMEWGPWQ